MRILRSNFGWLGEEIHEMNEAILSLLTKEPNANCFRQFRTNGRFCKNKFNSTTELFTFRPTYIAPSTHQTSTIKHRL